MWISDTFSGGQRVPGVVRPSNPAFDPAPLAEIGESPPYRPMEGSFRSSSMGSSPSVYVFPNRLSDAPSSARLTEGGTPGYSPASHSDVESVSWPLPFQVGASSTVPLPNSRSAHPLTAVCVVSSPPLDCEHSFSPSPHILFPVPYRAQPPVEVVSCYSSGPGNSAGLSSPQAVSGGPEGRVSLPFAPPFSPPQSLGSPPTAAGLSSSHTVLGGPEVHVSHPFPPPFLPPQSSGSPRHGDVFSLSGSVSPFSPPLSFSRSLISEGSPSPPPLPPPPCYIHRSPS